MLSIFEIELQEIKTLWWIGMVAPFFLECSTLLYSSKNFKNCRTFKIVFEVFNLEGFPHQDRTLEILAVKYKLPF
jgi:hypothetical protein